ncbi:unnamed protein product [Schistosoma turkestanicum]|nr:unnamed protein product [Schistosoma turkestanicum]
MDNHEESFGSLIEEASFSKNISPHHQVKADTLVDLPTCLSKRSDLPPIQKHERRFSSHSEKKSVTFSFSGSERSNHILNASDCFAYMRKGSEMIKLHTSGRQYHKRIFYLNEQMNCIKWSSTNHNNIKRQSNSSQIDIEEIHEVQLGCSSRTTHSLTRRRRPLSMTPTLSHHLLATNLLSSTSLNQQTTTTSSSSSSKSHSFNQSNSFTIGSTNNSTTQIQNSSTSLNSLMLNLSSCTFTICYGADFTVLEILATSPEEANIWVTGLKCLMAGAQDPQVLEDRQKPRDRWLQIMFHEADSTNQGYLSEFDVIRLIRSINPSLSSIHLRHKLKEMESKVRSHKTGITKDDFVNFFKKVATRQEIYYILIRYSSGSEHLSAEDLKNFFESEQGRTGLTRDQCTAIINRFEPSLENRQYNVMGIDGFTLLLLSEECDIFNPVHLQVCQDMSQPITHYYIASSHKTFLLEDQLTGPCSIEGYQRALLSGCRYIELEVYDGHDGHPVVRRANSRPPGIPIQVVLNTIHDFAFIRSDYGYFLYCSRLQLFHTVFPSKIPIPLLNYGLDHGFSVPFSLTNESTSSQSPVWCSFAPPFSYSHIQKIHWNVGLWGYYQLRQIPNFILALPVVALCFICSVMFYRRAPKAYRTFGLYAECEMDRNMVPYVFHMLFLCAYGVLHINIQVLTRLIFSSCPIIYWFCAYLLCDTLPNFESLMIMTNKHPTTTTISSSSSRNSSCSCCSSSNSLLNYTFEFNYYLINLYKAFNPFQYHLLKHRMILCYFIGYALLGCILHPNFLPWT